MIYFDHDTSASKDTKIVCLRNRCGGAAVDGYWAILETIYQNECDFVFGENQAETEALTLWLGVGFDYLNNWVNEMINLGLLVVNDEGENASGFFKLITSERAIDNISEYKAKREAARQNGKLGGRKPKANRTLTKSVSKNNQTLTQPLAIKKEKEKEKIEKDIPNGISKKTIFTPPSTQEISDYAASKGLAVDAQRFCDYYAAQGWKLSNGNPMKDWQAAVRNWARPRQESGGERDEYSYL